MITGLGTQKKDQIDASLDGEHELSTFSWSWILLLLHCRLQPHWEMLVPPSPRPPTCLSLESGEEAAGDTEQEQGCWSRWRLPQNPESLRRPAMTRPSSVSAKARKSLLCSVAK